MLGAQLEVLGVAGQDCQALYLWHWLFDGMQGFIPPLRMEAEVQIPRQADLQRGSNRIRGCLSV